MAVVIFLLHPPPRAFPQALPIIIVLALSRAFAPGDIKYLLTVSLALPFKPFLIFLVLSFLFSAIEIIVLFLFCITTRRDIPKKLRMAVPMGVSLFCYLGGMY